MRALDLERAVLVVDDDPDGLRYTVSTLNRNGIQAIGASREEACGVYSQRKNSILLLLLDIGITQSTRLDLDSILSLNPHMRVVLMTSYKHRLEQFGYGLENTGIIYKPFTPAELLLCVRRILSVADQSPKVMQAQG